MNLNLQGVLHIRCRTLSDASREAIHYGVPAKLEDEGEVIANVTPQGFIYDLDGKLVPIGHLRVAA